jgi:hypothetical protein
LLILLVLFGAITVSATQDPPADPWGLDNTALYTWQVLSYTAVGPQCTLVVDHLGAPSEQEIRLNCDDSTIIAWQRSQACISLAAYGQDHECEGLYLQWVASQPYSPYASITLNQPMWGIIPGIENLPPWLAQLENVAALTSDRPLSLLAGQLIAKQYVNASA